MFQKFYRTAINNNVKRSNEKDYETTDDFRRIQETIKKIAKNSGHQRIMETFQKSKDSVWQEYLDDNWDPSTALYTEDQGL